MNPIPNIHEQRLVAGATLVVAKNTSESMEKFVHWTLAGAAAGLTYILGQKQFQVRDLEHIGFLIMIAAIIGLFQRYISMIVTNAVTVSSEVEKLVDPQNDINPNQFLLIYINSLPVSLRFSAAWAATNLLKGDLITFPRYIFIAALVQSVLGAGIAIIVLRAAYLIIVGVTAAGTHP